MSNEKWNFSKHEEKIRKELIELFKNSPLPDHDLLLNLPLYSRRHLISHILFLDEIYKKNLNVHGIIAEFGVRWGRNLALFESLRGIYEPFNHNRKIVGFDTFEGFPSVHEKDGNDSIIKKGAWNVTENYFEYLEKIMDYHEAESPINHIKKYELVKGDVVNTIKTYLKKCPETIFSLVYFDMDIYKPTMEVLIAILPHLTIGTVLAFDELNVSRYPGETQALKEVLGLNNCRIHHSPYSPTQSYIIMK